MVQPDVPLALARLHRATPAGALLTPASIRAIGPLRDLFRESNRRGLAADVIVGGGFGRERASLRRLRTLPDWVGPKMRVLVCGLNPSIVSADVGVGYAGRSNRFWPAALAAGLVTTPRDPERALAEGVGFTDLVKRATRAAAELSPQEYRDGLARVTRLVEWLQPRVVVFVGLAGWRAAVERSAAAGWQAAGLGGAETYVMPSTSGLNARVPLAALADHLRAITTRFE